MMRAMVGVAVGLAWVALVMIMWNLVAMSVRKSNNSKEGGE